MKQLVLSATEMAIFGEIAVIIFFGIFMTALYRVSKPSPQRRRVYEDLAGLALTNDAPPQSTTRPHGEVER